MQPLSQDILGAMTVDVEEWFHAHNLRVPPQEWNDLSSRVHVGLKRLLTLFADTHTRATFFVLGWVAERQPELIRDLHAAGHEIASHGHAHTPIAGQSVRQFRSDIERAKNLLEDIIAAPVSGYRAPSYSVTRRTWWSLTEIRDAGYTYDSSIHPVRSPHGRYGMPGGRRQPYEVIAGLQEYPLPVVDCAGITLPIATGGYLRVLPQGLQRRALAQYRRARAPMIINVHPWELDPRQPRHPAPLRARVLHYAGLTRTETRLRDLLTRGRFVRIRDLEDMRPRSAAREHLKVLPARAPQSIDVSYIAPSGTL